MQVPGRPSGAPPSGAYRTMTTRFDSSCSIADISRNNPAMGANKIKKKTKKSRPVITDRHILYEGAVQEVEADLDFMKRVFRRRHKRPLRLIREDFCGTAKLTAEWISQHPDNRAIGVDFDQPTLDWGIRHHFAPLGDIRKRARLICDDVRAVSGPPVDAIAAFNFSYFIFKERDALRNYYRHARSCLKKGGMLFMDAFGGTQSMTTNHEYRDISGARMPDGTKIPKYVYEWEHRNFDVITNHILCHIHFELHDGTRIEKAFTYDWRLWTLPEMQELLLEAGFSKAEVYIHGWQPDGEADSVFRLRKHYDNEEGWIAYVVGVK